MRLATSAALLAAAEAAFEAALLAADEAAFDAALLAADEAAFEAALVAAEEAAFDAALLAAEEAAFDAALVAADEAARFAADDAADEAALLAADEAALLTADETADDPALFAAGEAVEDTAPLATEVVDGSAPAVAGIFGEVVVAAALLVEPTDLALVVPSDRAALGELASLVTFLFSGELVVTSALLVGVTDVGCIPPELTVLLGLESVGLALVGSLTVFLPSAGLVASVDFFAWSELLPLPPGNRAFESSRTAQPGWLQLMPPPPPPLLPLPEPLLLEGGRKPTFPWPGAGFDPELPPEPPPLTASRVTQVWPAGQGGGPPLLLPELLEGALLDAPEEVPPPVPEPGCPT
ncbi:hypothetical protein [Bradyrhizobium sp. RD5-C2]|uniref:hypothetical protein n=1 Tax=Bradyrhizobium sp. RD5-C2 TaxID=244562 RepID=UPI001CC47BAC|nr:hypothetical protein [Bradyrhizobium sp. RD5-C2]GIQ75352.1 hypothetical protein BraRD5C2_37930 [Bradyrhizobium sp. RD5-C2]